MVVINVEIAGGIHFEIKETVLGKELKHVVEKPYTSADVRFPTTVDIEFERNLRFPRFADNFSFAFHTIFVVVATPPSYTNLRLVLVDM